MGHRLQLSSHISFGLNTPAGRSVENASESLEPSVMDMGERWSHQRGLTRGVEVDFLVHALFLVATSQILSQSSLIISFSCHTSHEHSCLLNHRKYMILTTLFICIVKITNSEEIKKWKTIILADSREIGMMEDSQEVSASSLPISVRCMQMRRWFSRLPVLSATARESIGYHLLGPFLTSKEGT